MCVVVMMHCWSFLEYAEAFFLGIGSNCRADGAADIIQPELIFDQSACQVEADLPERIGSKLVDPDVLEDDFPESIDPKLVDTDELGEEDFPESIDPKLADPDELEEEDLSESIDSGLVDPAVLEGNPAKHTLQQLAKQHIIHEPIPKLNLVFLEIIFDIHQKPAL